MTIQKARVAQIPKAHVTVNEAAAALGLQPPTIRKFMRARAIGYIKLGRHAVRIPRSEIDRIIKEGTVPATATR